MPGLNLTRVESIERASHLEVLGYEVIIDTTIGDEVFGVHATARFTCNETGYDTFIDAVGKRVLSAVLNGTPLDVSSYDGKSIFLNALEAENELVVEMESIYSKSGEGLQRSIDPSDGEVYLYSQCAPAFARLIFPCFDQPNLKAPFALTVIAPDEWTVLSNNPLKTKTELAGQKIQWEFTPTPKIASYIYALIAGPYHHVHDEYVGAKKVPLGIYLRKSLAEHLDADKIFQATKDGFAFYEGVFGLAYPFDKYDQIAVVDYNWGAMENPGAVTFKEDLFIFRSKVTDRQYAWRTSVILHEMAHMWFGDMVTMEWWNDIWLNESFAEWISYLALSESTRFTNAWVSFNIDIKNWGYRQDQLSSTHPVVTAAEDVEMASTNFDGISYAKGASILKQLFAYVGREAFISGLQKYFEKHAWKNTTLADLLTELEIASGLDLKEWSSSWLESAGVTTLRPILEISEGNYTSVTILQEAPSIPIGSTQLPPHRISIGLYD
jgi:aminopeptidase N